MAETFLKDPQALLDWGWDWSNWLKSGETVNSSSLSVTVSSSLTVATSPAPTVSQASAGVVVAWISGGISGTDETATCTMMTSAGRRDVRTIVIDVDNR